MKASDLRITANGRRLAQEALVGLTGIRVQQLLSAPAQCELYFRSPPGPLETARSLVIGTRLEVQLTDSDVALFMGDITAVEHEYGPENVQQIYVRGYDPLYRLRKRQQVRLFENPTLGSLVQEVAAEIGVRASVPHIKLNWDRFYQYQQDDLALITHVAAQYGYYLTMRDNHLHLITLEGMGATHTLTLGGNLSQVAIEANANEATDEVAATGWNTSRMEMHTTVVKNGRSGRHIATKSSEIRAAGQRRHYLVNENTPNQDHAVALAQAELDYRTATEVTLRGETSGNPLLQPGARVRVEGVERPFVGSYVLTEVTHDLQAGEYTTQISTAPPTLPERTQTDIATFGEVSHINDPANAGRVRVTLPTYNSIETDWMNVVMPGAGPSKGFIMLPDKGDKVLVILTQGNPGQGIVVGGLFGANRLPDDGISLGSSVTSQSWFSPGGQKIQLDDRGNKIRLENDSGAYIEMAGGHITIVGSRIDFRRINLAKQLLNEASDVLASEENIRAELTEWLQRQSEKNGRVVVILIIFAILAFLIFIGYVLFQSFFSGA